jgi:hypothetical protein
MTFDEIFFICIYSSDRHSLKTMLSDSSRPVQNRVTHRQDKCKISNSDEWNQNY